MRRVVFRLMVALLTFVMGVASVSLRYVLGPPSPVATNAAEDLPPTTTPARPEREYIPLNAGRGMPKDGASVAFTDWQTSDGITFGRVSEYHASPERANRELQKVLTKAARVIKREPLFDEDGLQVGEKVISTFPGRRPEGGLARLLWTQGSTLRYVSSSSLEDILELEKDFKIINSQLR